MSNGFQPSDFVSRNTSDIVFNQKTVDDVEASTRWFTQGAVSLADFGDTGDRDHRKACAYLIGATLAWARLSGAEIPEEMTRYLMDVRAAYLAGLEHRYEELEAAGALVAETEHKARNETA